MWKGTSGIFTANEKKNAIQQIFSVKQSNDLKVFNNK